jgi:hypothetical protein
MLVLHAKSKADLEALRALDEAGLLVSGSDNPTPEQLMKKKSSAPSRRNKKKMTLK